MPGVHEPKHSFVERRRPLMTARWSNPLLLTFRAPAELLRPLVHPNLALDEREGQCHVSVVAFEFQDTRLRGRRIPGFVNFSQLNLRTYVRLGNWRGVIHLREYVPSRMVAVVARLKFNEPYHLLDIATHTQSSGDALHVRHAWHDQDTEQFIEITASQASSMPPEDGSVYHFTEHRWGYGTTRSGDVVRYRVEHPHWAIREIRSMTYRMDFGTLFGEEWSILNGTAPDQVTMAVGSAVQMFPPGR